MEDSFASVLEAAWGLHPRSIRSQAGGWAALAYRIEAEEGTYFLKFYEKRRASTEKWTALIDAYSPVMAYLAGTPALGGRVCAALETVSGHYSAQDEAGIYMLFPFVPGPTPGFGGELSGPEVDRLAETVAALHGFGKETPGLRRSLWEDYQAPFCGDVAEYMAGGWRRLPGPLQAILAPHRVSIEEKARRCPRLGQSLASQGTACVLCHTDIHGGNIIRGPQGLVLVDWEGLKLAPAEADLFLLADKPWYPRFGEIYTALRPDYRPNAMAMEFYTLRRWLEDLYEWIQQLLFDRPDAKTQAEIYRIVQGMF